MLIGDKPSINHTHAPHQDKEDAMMLQGT